MYLLAILRPHSAATKIDVNTFFVAPVFYMSQKKGCIFLQKNYLKTKTLVTVALLIAVSIVIVRFLSFQTEILRISFGFIPASLCSMLFGPWIGAVASFLSDFLGMLINSKGMSYFPGFGLSEALYGFTYALFLYKKEKNFVRIILCVSTNHFY